jgi:hypothetical protein
VGAGSKTVVAGDAVSHVSGAIDGVGLVARFSYPNAVVFDKKRQLLYITDRYVMLVLKRWDKCMTSQCSVVIFRIECSWFTSSLLAFIAPITPSARTILPQVRLCAVAKRANCAVISVCMRVRVNRYGDHGDRYPDSTGVPGLDLGGISIQSTSVSRHGG